MASKYLWWQIANCCLFSAAETEVIILEKTNPRVSICGPGAQWWWKLRREKNNHRGLNWIIFCFVSICVRLAHGNRPRMKLCIFIPVCAARIFIALIWRHVQRAKVLCATLGGRRISHISRGKWSKNNACVSNSSTCKHSALNSQFWLIICFGDDCALYALWLFIYSANYIRTIRILHPEILILINLMPEIYFWWLGGKKLNFLAAACE